MLAIIAINLVVVITLIGVIAARNVERALPYFVFFVTVLPEECRIPIPGLFDLYTRRLALAILVIAFVSVRKRSVIRTLPLKHLILMHTGWIIVSTMNSIVVVTSVKQMIAQIIEYYVIYYVFVKTVSDVSTIKRMALAMIAAVAVACGFGLFEVYAHWSVLSIFPAELQLTYGTGNALYAELMDRGIRARSVFTHPILFGGAISMMVPLTLYFLTTVKSVPQRLLLNVALVLMFWNLYKTSSRGPWLATCLSLAVLMLAASARVRKRILAVAVLAALVLVTRPGIASTIWNMYRATLDPTSKMGYSYQYRPVLLKTVMKTLTEQPSRGVVGFGLGSFREKGLVLVIPGIETHRWYTCDSAWILFAYETGFIGLMIAALLLIKPAFLALRGSRRLPKPDRHFSLICFSSMLSFFFVMLSVAAYGWGQNGHMLWMLIAMTISYLQISNKRPAVRTERPPTATGADPWSTDLAPATF
jgi:hypothetical protein